MKKIIGFLLLIFIFSLSLYSKDSIIKGKIRDSNTKEGISELKVLLMGKFRNFQSVTNNNGLFVFNNIKPNNYYVLNVYKKSKLIFSKRIRVVKKREYVSLILDVLGDTRELKNEFVNISGRVIDGESLLNIKRAYVFLDGGEKFTITDRNGKYFFSDISSGVHILKIKYKNYKTLEKEVKLTKKEEYVDFELFKEKSKVDNSYFISSNDKDNVKSDESEITNEKDEYLSENMLETGFEDAVKQVVSDKKVRSVSTGNKALSEISKLKKSSRHLPTLLGPTGLIDISSVDTLNSGQVNFGVGIFSGDKATIAGDINTTLSSYKLVYGFKDNIELGISNLQKEYGSYFNNNNSQLFHMKYNLKRKGPIKVAFGYSYINDDIINNNNILNMITQYSFRTGRFVNNLIMNLSTSTDFSDTVNSYVNFGIESKPLFVRYPMSYIFEMEQNDNNEFKILNFGLRLKKNPSFDFVYKKEIDSSNQMFGLGSNLQF